ncbi:ATP-binding protein [Streptomyces katsurahamanus]|uniref:ATP-binding protein n=1 Tax=Streptomyces katsurahamanus TaxID=2577098 RepID=A0ABW9NSV8_9ACTN|nr:ATP-binding protein [Streptomyces katsurahamanus]MQS36154.1 ATP-binding protein [Streptomyces katsurahamanus]
MNPAHSKTMPCLAESAGTARDLVHTALVGWGMNGLINEGVLLVTELVANAAVHTWCHTITVSVSPPGQELVRIEVSDQSTALPVQRTASGDDTGGRGLALVDALSFRWGADAESQGKRVWAELKAESLSPPGGEAAG